MTNYNIFSYQARVPCGEIFFTRLFNVLCITIAEELFFSPQIYQESENCFIYFLCGHLKSLFSRCLSFFFSIHFAILFVSFIIWNNKLILREDLKGFLVCLPLCPND